MTTPLCYWGSLSRCPQCFHCAYWRLMLPLSFVYHFPIRRGARAGPSHTYTSSGWGFCSYASSWRLSPWRYFPHFPHFHCQLIGELIFFVNSKFEGVTRRLWRQREENQGQTFHWNNPFPGRPLGGDGRGMGPRRDPGKLKN